MDALVSRGFSEAEVSISTHPVRPTRTPDNDHSQGHRGNGGREETEKKEERDCNEVEIRAEGQDQTHDEELGPEFTDEEQLGPEHVDTSDDERIPPPPTPHPDGLDREARKAAAYRDPGAPSKQEVDEHDLTHMPFRSWCKYCVRGRAKELPHGRGESEDSEVQVPIVAMD